MSPLARTVCWGERQVWLPVCQPAVHPASRGRSRERLQVADCSSVQAGGPCNCSSCILPFLKGGNSRTWWTQGQATTHLSIQLHIAGGGTFWNTEYDHKLSIRSQIPKPDHQRLKIPNRSALDQQEAASLELETDCLQLCSLPQLCRESQSPLGKGSFLNGNQVVLSDNAVPGRCRQIGASSKRSHPNDRVETRLMGRQRLKWA